MRWYGEIAERQRFSTDVVGSSSRRQQQQQQHLDQKMKMDTYEAIHPPTMTSPRPKNRDEHVFRCNLFIYFSSMHPVSTTAQSTTITEASQSKGQKYKQPRTTEAIGVPSMSLRFSTDVVGSSRSRQQQQENLDQKVKINTYEVIHPPTMTSPRP